MILIGASIGLGTSFIFPDWRVLVFGVAFGFIIGLIATGTFLNFLQVSFTGRDSPIVVAIGVLVFGLLPGLLPAFLARRNQRTNETVIK
jgi:LytS/YehU family sensor histidine kinase